MDSIKTTLQKQKEFSLSRLEELQKEIASIDELKKHRDLCIYVTGSFGRHEATKFSDLDLFFISSGKSSEHPVPRLSKALIDADLIRLTDRLGFPPFSRDGEFLQIHYMEDIKSHLGSPNDDFSNYFTARLLLLLESYPVYNNSYYNTMVSDMVRTYYRDFHDHVENFLPIFLVNDIIRYWKTLCMNYEHSRSRPTEEIKRLKTHVKNLKLVFSRKLTCFSLVIAIVSKYCILVKNNQVLNEETLLPIIQSTPVERLEQVSLENPDVKEIVIEILELYSWFIDRNNQDENELLKWMGEKSNRNEAFGKGRKDFGGKLFELLMRLTKGSPELLKYLLI